MMNAQEIWEKALLIIQQTASTVSYNTFILPAKINNINEELKIVYIDSGSDFNLAILEKRYKELFKKSIEEVTGETYRIVIKASSEYEAMNVETTTAPAKPSAKPLKMLDKDLKKQKIFNPKYTFDNFVEGNSNKYAYSACRAVAADPSNAINPLFIYGGSGLGKTHLMNAIGIHLLENNENINVLNVSSEMFTNELVNAIREGKMNEFKHKYRQVDVLLIDDIQFLEGKESTQEEFFHTFNTLYDLNKQIVISSDRPPNKLETLDARLRSRFSMNMVADIQPADYETRIAILLKKAENENLEVDDNVYAVICFIAEKIKDNIRELEGAFTRLVSFSKIMKENIDMAFAKRVLKELMQNKNASPTPEKIKTIVSRHFEIKVSELEGNSRKATIAYPRQIAMYLCKELTDYSNQKIGNLFGNKHYSTVIHACNKIEEELDFDEELQNTLSTLKESITE